MRYSVAVVTALNRFCAIVAFALDANVSETVELPLGTVTIAIEASPNLYEWVLTNGWEADKRFLYLKFIVSESTKP